MDAVYYSQTKKRFFSPALSFHSSSDKYLFVLNVTKWLRLMLQGSKTGMNIDICVSEGRKLIISGWGCEEMKLQQCQLTSDTCTPVTARSRRTDRFLRAFERKLLLWDGLHKNCYYLCHSASGSAEVMKRNICVAPACRRGTVISAAHTSDSAAHTSSLWIKHDSFL